jgi:hypothetical protein
MQRLVKGETELHAMTVEYVAAAHDHKLSVMIHTVKRNHPLRTPDFGPTQP